MVIRILDIVPGADTSDQGALVFKRLQSAFGTDQVVTVSFDGVNTATSSFVSAGFVPLLKDIPFRDLKLRLRVVDSTRQINTTIRNRLEREALVAA